MVTTKRYAVTYLPSKNGFAVTEMKTGVVIKKQYLNNTQYVIAKSKKDAMDKVSSRSHKAEVKRKRR